MKKWTVIISSSGVITLIFLLFAGETSSVLPLINDITTDTSNPPNFNAVSSLRRSGDNPVKYGGPEIAARQKKHYEDIKPIHSNLNSNDAFLKALEIAKIMGWKIVASDFNSGMIEATDTTRFFRFKDDVVIRITKSEQGSQVDIRSQSRIGISDLGKHASRVRTFIQKFNS